MSEGTNRAGKCVIQNGQTLSNWLTRKNYEDALGLVLLGPVAGAETFTIQVSNDDENPTAIWTFQAGTPLADVVAPPTGKAALIPGLQANMAFRIVASVAVGALRTIEVMKTYDAYAS